jgi:pimeloyl-ACP methyl ester carboxylesterase
MYHTIAPTLASKGFLVIVPDLPGMGASEHHTSAPLTAKNASEALFTVIKFLGLSQVHVFGFDQGCSPAMLLARDYPDLVKGVITSEFALPGFGLETFQQPRKGKTLMSDWHLALFTVPKAAVFLIKGREEQFLAWYFGHAAYTGLSAVNLDHFRRYVHEWQKPGGLEASVEFLGGSTWTDADELKGLKIKQRMLVMGGEASLGTVEVIEQFWGQIPENRLDSVVIPKCGHWLGDENPKWVANYLSGWIKKSEGDLAVADLEWLQDKLTLNVDT